MELFIEGVYYNNNGWYMIIDVCYFEPAISDISKIVIAFNSIKLYEYYNWL